MNDHARNNLDDAREIVNEIAELRAAQEELKRAFKNDDLEGGWRAALTHPLYLSAAERIETLHEQLKGLI